MCIYSKRNGLGIHWEFGVNGWMGYLHEKVCSLATATAVS